MLAVWSALSSISRLAVTLTWAVCAVLLFACCLSSAVALHGAQAVHQVCLGMRRPL